MFYINLVHIFLPLIKANISINKLIYTYNKHTINNKGRKSITENYFIRIEDLSADKLISELLLSGSK